MTIDLKPYINEYVISTHECQNEETDIVTHTEGTPQPIYPIQPQLSGMITKVEVGKVKEMSTNHKDVPHTVDPTHANGSKLPKETTNN